jgi:hypothetical protein
MKSKSVIFVALSLLVVVMYSSSSFIPFQASAAGPISCNRTGTMKITCCQDHVINRTPANPAGTLVTYCTDCDVTGVGESVGPAGYTNCGERYIQMSAEEPPMPVLPAAVARLQEGGVLGEATTLPNLSQSVGPREGVLQTENNLTFSQADISSNNDSNNTMALDQSNLASDTVKKPTRTVENDGEGQDESQTTEEPSDEAVDQDKND